MPLPTRMNCLGRSETETPLVTPIATPLNNVMVASVAKIGVIFKIAIKIELIKPQIKPTKIPDKQAIRIHAFDSSPAAFICSVIMYAATSAAAFEIPTIERSMPPVSIESITAIDKIAISGT